MKSLFKRNILTTAIGTTLAVSAGLGGIANADTNPFEAQHLTSGYQSADAASEGKCGEGQKGSHKAMEEGKCGEGKCGGGRMSMMRMMDADGDGNVSRDEFMKGGEKMFTHMDSSQDDSLDSNEFSFSQPVQQAPGEPATTVK